MPRRSRHHGRGRCRPRRRARSAGPSAAFRATVRGWWPSSRTVDDLLALGISATVSVCTVRNSSRGTERSTARAAGRAAGRRADQSVQPAAVDDLLDEPPKDRLRLHRAPLSSRSSSTDGHAATARGRGGCRRAERRRHASVRGGIATHSASANTTPPAPTRMPKPRLPSAPASAGPARQASSISAPRPTIERVGGESTTTMLVGLGGQAHEQASPRSTTACPAQLHLEVVFKSSRSGAGRGARRGRSRRRAAAASDRRTARTRRRSRSRILRDLEPVLTAWRA